MLKWLEKENNETYKKNVRENINFFSIWGDIEDKVGI